MTGELTHRPLTRSSPRQAAVRGKALELATQVLLVTLVPRLLGPAEFGRLTVALAIVTLGAVAISLGSPTAFARFVPAEPEPRRAGLARSMTTQLLPLRGAQLAIAGVICAILGQGRSVLERRQPSPPALPPRFQAGLRVRRL